MADAYYKYGELRTVEYTASGADIDEDQIVVLGGVDAKKCSVGVAMKGVADGSTVEGAIAVSGVFQFPKVSAAVITAGQSVNWDSSAGAVDDNAHTTAAGDVGEFGKAMADGANGETTILVEISEPGTYDAA